MDMHLGYAPWTCTSAPWMPCAIPFFFFLFGIFSNQRVRSRGNFRTINVRGPQTTRGIIISKGLLSRSSQLLAANRKQPFNQYP